MRRRPFIAFAFAATIPLWLGLSRMRAQDSEDRVAKSKNSNSDRDEAGLRGPVRSFVEETTHPGWTTQDGTDVPEFKGWRKTEYDREGRIAAMWGRNSSREHGLGAELYVTRYTYNVAGQLLRRTLENDGKVESEVVYRYDDQGRLQSVTNSQDPDNPIAFRYDAIGRKTKIATAKPMPSGRTVSTSTEYLFQTDSRPVTLPDGGSAVTIYDEHDRPTEIQSHNVNGDLIYRTLRIYDEQGRVVEEKQMMDDPLRMFPAAEQKKILDEGVSAQDLRDQFAQFLGGSEMWSNKYVYDAQDRKTETIQKMLNHEKFHKESSYNEHGDVVKETSQRTTRGSGNPDVEGTQSSETIFSYEYDSYGNWTVKRTSTRTLPDGTFKDSGDEVRRTIEYY